jgi:MFS family permease
MTEAGARVRRTYLTLTLLTTLAASTIWGINTLFLLDAGLSNAQAFAANAFFTVGQVLFEVPTGAVADTWGRRASFLLGAGTLLVATLLYVLMWKLRAPMWGWALASVLIGLGFTFFSGATEAWLVDALEFTGAKGELEAVLARGQVMGGVAMLAGSVGGGFIAQFTNLGVPYVVRSALLGLTLVVAAVAMKDLGFTPDPSHPLQKLRSVLRASVQHGLKNPPVRWVMLAAPFTMGAGIYAFYALQPYLLELYGDPEAFGIAGVAAAVVAATQIAAGFLGPHMRRLFRRRTDAMILTTIVGALALGLLGWTTSFWVALALLIASELTEWAAHPMRQAYLNGLIPSAQRATVLSFDNLMASAGGVVAQPALGRMADVVGYARTYVACSVLYLAALPFLLLARRQNAPSDKVD